MIAICGLKIDKRRIKWEMAGWLCEWTNRRDSWIEEEGASEREREREKEQLHNMQFNIRDIHTSANKLKLRLVYFKHTFDELERKKKRIKRRDWSDFSRKYAELRFEKFAKSCHTQIMHWVLGITLALCLIRHRTEYTYSLRDSIHMLRQWIAAGHSDFCK